MASKKTILLVDDEPVVTKMLSLYLEMSGTYTVTTVNDPARAVAEARACRPDAVILDVRMPGLSGEVIAEQLRQDESLKGVVIVFLTAARAPHGQDGQDDEDRRLGVRRRFIKPVDPQELLDFFDAELDGSP